MINLKQFEEIKPNTAKVVRRLVLEAAAQTNSMGNSSSVHGTGAIDTFDPKLGKKKVRRLKKRTNKVLIHPTQTQTENPQTQAGSEVYYD